MLQRNSDLPYVIPDEPVGRPAEGWQYPTVDLREMGRILRRRYRLVALPAAALIGLAVIYLLFATTLYTATSTVLVDPRRANVVETNQSVLSNFGTDDATIESQTLLIQSVAILVRVVDKLKLTEDEEFAPKPGLLDPIKRLCAARVQTAEARAKFEQVQDIAKSGGDPGGINAAISSEMITKLRTQYADIAKNEADLSSKYGARHPLVANVRAQRRDTQRLINEEIRRILESTKHDYDVARSRETSLQQSLDQLQGVSSSSGQAQVRLRELQREAAADRTQYESYLARSKDTTAQESLEMPDSRIVTKASIPIRPSSPKTMLILGLAVMLGLGAGTVLAFLADYLDRRVKTLEQAEAISGVPALAAVPLIGARELAGLARRGRNELGRYDPKTMKLLPAPLQPPLTRYAIDEPGTFFAEAIRAVRLALQRTMRSQPVKVVQVTSALDGEGKTTLAINLAQSLAMLGIRTLLIDGDLRNPQVTRALCPRADAGLLEVAIGQTAPEHAILVDRSTGLSILPSTPIREVEFITELMFSDRIVDVLDHFRHRYELIVIDSPPLVPLVDGRALAELPDRIILALAWYQAPGEVLSHPMDLLSPVSDRIMGTVLTRVDLRRLQFYDYYRSSAYLKPYGAASLHAGATR